MFGCVLISLFLGATAAAREIYVDNLAGDDRSTGRQARDPGGTAGAVHSLAQALRLAGSGDTIVLVKTDTPYRESVTLMGNRHGGTADRPFTIRGNGAVLDGSAPVPSDAWEHVRGAIFRLRSTPTSYPLLFLDGRPAMRVVAAQKAKEPPDLQPRQWCSMAGQIYFCVEPGKLPRDYKLSCPRLTTGFTLFHVEHVRIADLVVQGFQLDGVNLPNSARHISLSGVTCQDNGRSGVAVGGASLAAIDGSLLAGNGYAQLLTLPCSETHVREVKLFSGSAPGWVDEGGRVYRDGHRIEGGWDGFQPNVSRESKP